ncbi:MAG: metal-sulfur cluster assembly factor [Gammaproteobacteria bacterium]
MSDDARILDILRQVIDPEIGLNIVDLGLVYAARYEDGAIHVLLTLTSPVCPLGAHVREQAEQALRTAFADAAAINVTLVWDPPWTPDRMSPAAKRQLGWEA